MKTTKSIVVSLFVLLATQIASAFYCPSTGRWLSRDPMGEQGFETLRTASAVPRIGQIVSSASMPSGRWINRDSVGEEQGRASFDSGPNPYDSVGNNPMNCLDPFGLAYGNPVSGPNGPVGPSDPYDPGGPYGPVYNPTPPSCREACVLKYVLGIEVDTTVIVSGQPIIEKRFVTPGSAEGTSIAGQMTDAVLGDAQLPARLPTISGGWKCCRIAYTKSASRFVSRAIPIVGWVMLDYDASGLAGCICGCPSD
jgi:hypothetical protein